MVGRLLLAVLLTTASMFATTFTASAAVVGSVVSDDFFGGMDGGLWRVVDPAGDGSVAVVGAGTGDARLSIGVPGGSSHDAWRSNGSVRVLQEVGDADFGVVVKFDSVPSGLYTDQGLQVVGGADRWLRFGVYFDGSGLRGFAASTTGTSSSKKINKPVSAPGGRMWLRVERSGQAFSFDYSADGQAWVSLGSFTDGLAVSSVGPYAGNAGGSTAVAHRALVDYVFDTAAPIVPEDGGLAEGAPGEEDPADTDAPVLSGVTVEAGSSSARVSWVSDEPTTGWVEYGTGSSYGQVSSSTALGTTHQVTLSGLAPATTYHYRIVAADAANNRATTQDATFTTEDDGPPEIALWHDGVLTIGANGISQPWANVIGNVTDASGVRSLSYQLNGGVLRPLTIGPDERRLQDPGDFNADIPLTDLRQGDNSVVLTATDAEGQTASVSTTVRLVDAPAPTLPYVLDWSSDRQVQDQATVVDGRWRAQDGRLKTTQLGYDRLVSIGDSAWTDYVVEVPVTVYRVGPGTGGNSGAALVGMALRWQGHATVDGAQPAWGYYPVGAYAWTRFYSQPKIQLEADFDRVRQSVDTDPLEFQFGAEYRMQARVTSLPDGTASYAFKMWLASRAEPASWSVEVVAKGPAAGSIALIAHQVEASFGTVEVRPS